MRRSEQDGARRERFPQLAIPMPRIDGRRDGEPPCSIFTVEDLTERKKMEEELRRGKEAAEAASRAKSEFLARISHEIRTPMTVLMASLELLLQAGPPPEQRELIEIAGNSAERLLALIDDVLDISRIEARRLKVEAEPFEVRDCVRQAVAMFACRAREAGLRLRWQVAPQVPPVVIGDSRRLGQVLVNLVGNAVKYTERGEVAVTVARKKEQLLFTVRDTGIGIPPVRIGEIFAPFTRLENSRHGGAGLGLAICKELVELMGGAIRAQSVEGRGSAFTFTLPIVPGTSAVIPVPTQCSSR